jgi:hypothetical protein
MPYNGEQFKIIGQLTVTVFKNAKCIDWIEVLPEYRRKHIGTSLWLLAEQLLDRTLEHNPISYKGKRFADSFDKSPVSGYSTHSRKAKH